ncbi:MAG: N-6 DNA methylase [Ignavibacteria bacterium]|nr:N-6 DNA methylase [Ignavibacteria bacterium]
MGSLVKTYSQEKLKGKIYTPAIVVNKMLDEISFLGENVLNKKILDPACGDGRFLVEIVRRIIKYVPQRHLYEQLGNIYGWDIDPIAVSKCIENLNQEVLDLNIAFDWNISVKDTLREIEVLNSIFDTEKGQFDIIIGNPPYIRIQHLETKYREYIQKNFNFCQKGSTDIFIAFFEICFKLLSENGIGVLITPNTYLHSQTAQRLRDYIKRNQNVKKIINYKWLQLFENASTYSAITIFTKKPNDYLIYEEYINEFKSNVQVVKYQSIKDKKIFNFSFEFHQKKGKKLKEICKIGVGITTLSDKSYIFSNYQDFDADNCFVDTFYKGRVKIEKGILKPIIKGSTFKGDKGHPREYILFPYYKDNGKYRILPESQLRESYPLAYEYLLSIKDILDKRDNGKPNPIAWYAFGRNQSLDSAFGKKIIFSPLSRKPNFILSNLEECTLYSGYYIKYDGDYYALLRELNSERMHKYILASSRDFRGGWKAYNKKILEEFIVYL